MPAGIGPGSLSHFEDRLLFHLVDLTGERPLGLFQGVSEADLAARMPGEFGSEEAFIRSEEFQSSETRETILAGVQNLEREGLVEFDGALGTLSTIRPTSRGRRRVREWRDEWEKRQHQRDREIQRRILQDLDRIRRADPANYQRSSHLDVGALCADLGITPADFLANAQRLQAQGKVVEYLGVDQMTLMDGHIAITEPGIRSLEATTAATRPTPTAEQAWVEVARLKRQLQLAERMLPSLITDEELRRRCYDLLVAEGDYDRVVREACVVLEDRIRKAAGYGKGQMGVALMQSAFSAKNPVLRLSAHEQEQQGAMNIFAGIMGFFRNDAGHNLVESYSQDDVIRLVAMIDLLLKLVSDAAAPNAATSGGATTS